jgi:hypothetical protein
MFSPGNKYFAGSGVHVYAVYPYRRPKGFGADREDAAGVNNAGEHKNNKQDKKEDKAV